MSELKLSDQTQVALPIKNIVAIVSAIVVAVWTYFGIVERLNRLETNEKLMAQDLLKTYKFGWKTSYYQNTYDIKTDEVKEDTTKQQLDSLIDDIMNSAEDDCESCKI